MKITGIIAEYNPFHNGHAYQIQRAKELSGADGIIVVMSGNYVQRGAPAAFDKFSRASMALSNGADFVFELPVLWSTASAEYFASAGIALLDALGCVDYISFGCETPDISLMTRAAEVLSCEPKAYSDQLAFYLKQGIVFPRAREKAMMSYLSRQDDFSAEPELSFLLQSPNNILAIEYIKAIIRQKSRLIPLPVLRRGSGYHTTQITENFCSATAIRQLLLDTANTPLSTNSLVQKIAPYVPQDVADHLAASGRFCLTEQDFSQSLFYRLLSERETGFSDYADGSVELSNRILHALSDFTDYKTFCESLKRKDVTYARISRLLLHILLNIRQNDYENGKNLGYIPYLRLLGFRREAARFFPALKKCASLPLITKPSKSAAVLDGGALSMFRQDVFASDLYYGVQAQKCGFPPPNECRRQIVIV